MPNNGNRLKQAQERARLSAEQGNKLSTEYVKTLNGINGRIILMALGSASLLMTFIGILFGSEKSVASLEYKYALIAVFGFVAGSALLLFYSWFVSMFRFLSARSFHTSDRAAVAIEEIAIAEENGIIDENQNLLTEAARETHLAEQRTALKSIESYSKKSKKWSEANNIFSNIALPLAYLVIVAAYVSAGYFFTGVVGILNG